MLSKLAFLYIFNLALLVAYAHYIISVSYTHLDVYKRQLINNAGVGFYALHEELNPVKISQMVRTNLEAPMIDVYKRQQEVC